MTSGKSERKAHPKRRSKKAGFDCIEFKGRAQARIHQRIKGMTRKEELAYWNRPADGPVEAWWRSIQRRSAVVRETPSKSSTGRAR